MVLWTRLVISVDHGTASTAGKLQNRGYKLAAAKPTQRLKHCNTTLHLACEIRRIVYLSLCHHVLWISDRNSTQPSTRQYMLIYLKTCKWVWCVERHGCFTIMGDNSHLYFEKSTPQQSQVEY